jgi:predicted nucleotidyltransferase
MCPQPLVDSLTITDVVDTIVRARHPERIILFGSHADGTNAWDSDLDLLIVTETDLPPVDRVLEIRRVFKQAPCPLDIQVYTPAELEYWKEIPSSFVHQILTQGRTLYERTPGNSGAAVGQPG